MGRAAMASKPDCTPGTASAVIGGSNPPGLTMNDKYERAERGEVIVHKRPSAKIVAVRHQWISNRAFAALTGIKKTCFVCGETDSQSKVCLGKKADK